MKVQIRSNAGRTVAGSERCTNASEVSAVPNAVDAFTNASEVSA
ncbi:hypothetical protein [Halovenus marina]